MAVPASSGPLPTPPRSASVRRRTVAAAAATVATAGLVLAGLSGSAQAEGETARPSAAAPAPAPGLLKAMSRDLGLTTEQAKTRLANEADAADTVDALRRALGDSYAGAHLSGKTSARLTVATTDERERARITEAGATARVVGRDLGDLDRVLKALDRAAAKSAPEGVRVWYADVERNAVVVETATNAAAHKLLGRAGVGGDEVTLRHTDAKPRTFADLRGGDAYYMNGSGRCSIGFSVKRGTQGGFVTAGHCGTVGTSTSGYNQQAQGTFQGSTFPGRDYAWVATNSNWTPRPTVNGYGRGDVTVAGSTQAPVGASVCRSGSTTGWHCGVVEQHNTSVTYPQGTVSGVTRTTVCAEPGDSRADQLQRLLHLRRPGAGDDLRRLRQLLQRRYDVLLPRQPGAPGVRPHPGDQRRRRSHGPAHRPAGAGHLGGRHPVRRGRPGHLQRCDLPLRPGPHRPAGLEPGGRPLPVEPGVTHHPTD